MKIVHLSDIHFRGLSRHDEYVRSFKEFFKIAKRLKPDIIYIGGDIVHSKTQGISPELIDILSWWFTGLAEIAPTHVILGNHDGLILNKDRQDAITPIIKALNNPRLFLYKKSGTYSTGIPGFNWCVFSCFDEEGWESVSPVEGEVNLALFHGGVLGSKTDINWNIEGEVKVDFFDGYDFGLLGDIHKLQYLDEEKRIAYPGSTIQQNYGEDPGKGFLLWDIKSKDEFSSKFYEIPHDMPFVTIEWKGNVPETMKEANMHPNLSRFRVKSETQINQTDIVHLHSELKHVKEASEIVYKYDGDFGESSIETSEDSFSTKDLRSERTLQILLRDYYKDAVLSDDEWETLENMLSKHFQNITSVGDAVRNTKWSIKTLEFDNTFAYGKGNYINFESLPGITGIFGRNRSGKSSIVGTLMYTLFNTTDRGPIKNVHIINSRKGHCKSTVGLGINGKSFKVERQSVKHQNRRGDVNATTHLNFYRSGPEGEMIQDLTEEQRRETEKVVRKYLGTADDFLMTSLASQGQMNTFIRERATSRKMILTKFLDLGIFEKMLESAKDESRDLQSQLKNVPDRDWDVAIYEAKNSLSNNRNKIQTIESELTEKRTLLHELKLELSKFDNGDVVTHHDIDSQKDLIKSLKNKKDENNLSLIKLDKEIKTNKDKLSKITKFKKDFPIEDLNERIEEQRNIETNLLQVKASHEKEKINLENQLRSIAHLSEVPCGDKFPTCKFIKDSYNNKALLEGQRTILASLDDQIKAFENLLKGLKKEKLEEKIKKYNSILSQEVSLLSNRNDLDFQVKKINDSTSSTIQKLKNAKEILEDLESKVVGADIDTKILLLKSQIKSVSDDINGVDAKRISLAESVGQLESKLSVLKDEKSKFNSLKESLKLYDLFSLLDRLNRYIPNIPIVKLPSHIAKAGFILPSSARNSPILINPQYITINIKLTAIFMLNFPFFDIMPSGNPNIIKIKHANGIANFL